MVALGSLLRQLGELSSPASIRFDITPCHGVVTRQAGRSKRAVRRPSERRNAEVRSSIRSVPKHVTASASLHHVRTSVVGQSAAAPAELLSSEAVEALYSLDAYLSSHMAMHGPLSSAQPIVSPAASRDAHGIPGRHDVEVGCVAGAVGD